VIKRADNLRPGDHARIRDSWHTITEIIEVNPSQPGGLTLEVMAGRRIVARLAPNDLVEVSEPLGSSARPRSVGSLEREYPGHSIQRKANPGRAESTYPFSLALVQKAVSRHGKAS
jgi:hypothetical protein